MPWYVALTGSIAVILIGIYKKLNIGLTMLVGALTLGLLAGLSPRAFTETLAEGLWNPITIMLVMSILLLGVLGHILKETGALEEIILNLQTMTADIRIITAVVPMLVGMLTVPGGAILSAPLLAETGSKIKISPERQAVINIWFRHVLYFALPIFPSLILAAQLSGISISYFVFHNLPLAVIGSIVGFFYLFRGYNKQVSSTIFRWKAALQLLRSLLPLVLVLILVVFFDLYFPCALLAGIFLALLNYLPKENRGAEVVKRLKTQIIPGIKFPMALVIAGIMLYKEMLAETAVITNLTDLVLRTGLPIIFMLLIIPFFVGMLTGDNSASVAILFPMFIPLLPVGESSYAAYLAFLYAGSTAGHIISPAHPCFSLTKEFFIVDINNVILPMLPLLAVIMVTGFLLTLLFGYY